MTKECIERSVTMPKRGWKEITLLQVKELGQLRVMLAAARRELQGRMRLLRRKKRGQESEEGVRQALAEIVQLAQMQMKVVPLEQDLLRAVQQTQNDRQAEDAPLSEADWKLLQDALTRRGHEALRSAGADRTGIDGSQQVK